MDGLGYRGQPYELTGEGEAWMGSQEYQDESGSWYAGVRNKRSLESKAFELGELISMARLHYLGTLSKGNRQALAWLGEKGYIRAAPVPYTVSELLHSLPPVGNLRKNMGTYVSLANGLPVSDLDLEDLRRDMEVVVGASEYAFDDLHEALKLAQSRKEKVLAIDEAMSRVHEARIALPVSPVVEVAGRLNRELGVEGMHKVVAILNKLMLGEK